MALLRFTDTKGREWEVWEVSVRALPADVLARHRDAASLPERWLCFTSATERRRLTTYPARWHAMTPVELEALCRAAVPRSVGFPAPTTLPLQNPSDTTSVGRTPDDRGA